MDDDVKIIQTPHDDDVIVSAMIANYDVKRILVDNGSSTNILFYSAFFRMLMSTERLRRVSILLVGFTEDAVDVEGELDLSLTIGTESR